MTTTKFSAALLAATALAGLATPAVAAPKRPATATRSSDAELRRLIAEQAAKIEELSARVAAMSSAPAAPATSDVPAVEPKKD